MRPSDASQRYAPSPPFPKDAPRKSVMSEIYKVSNLHSDLLDSATEGVKAGVAAELCTILVDGVVAAFEDVPLLGLVAGNKFGRAVLSLLVPYGLCVLTIIAPQAIPNQGAVALRRVCLYAVQGHATMAVQPIVGRLRATIRRVLDAAKEQGVVVEEKE